MIRLNTAVLGIVACCIALVIAACGAVRTSTITSEALAQGNASAGEAVFRTNCSACHSTGTEKGVGSGMAGVLANSAPLPNGEPRTEVSVAEWIRSGGRSSAGWMPPQSLTDQQLADVIAYLRTLK